MAMEALGPFTGEQIFSGAIADAMRNRDASGRQVYNPQDTPERIGAAIAKKIFWDPFVPGTVVSGSRILSAATGQVSESGRAYDLMNELGSVLLGQRVSSLDARQGLSFATNSFTRQMRDATMLFNREFMARGSRSAADVVSGYTRSNEARKRLVEWLRARQKAAVTLGLTRKETESILKQNNLSSETVKTIMSGVYTKFKASDEAFEEAAPERRAAYQSIYNDTETTEILP
jgi:DNA-binding CsgD family transcriptional regulator